MKKALLAIALFGALVLNVQEGYAETTKRVKEQPQLFSISCNAP